MEERERHQVITSDLHIWEKTTFSFYLPTGTILLDGFIEMLMMKTF